jgi:hypothetical protein
VAIEDLLGKTLKVIIAAFGPELPEDCIAAFHPSEVG